MKARTMPIAPTATACLFLALSCASPPAHGQAPPESWQGVYVGGGGTYSNVSVEVPGSCYDCDSWWGDYPDYDEGDGDYSFALHAGYRVARYFAVEASYIDAGTIGWDKPYVYFPELGGYYHNHVDFNAKVPELSAIAILPFLQSWEVYLRLGAGFWNADSEQTLINVATGTTTHQHLSDDGVGFVAGLGLGVGFAQAWHVRAEFQSAWIDGDALAVSSDTTLDTFMLELQYRFGAHQGGTSR